MEVTYCFMTEEDIDEVAELESLAFSQSWSAKGIKHYFDSGSTLFITAKAEGKVIGYLAVFCVLDEGNLISLVVDNKYRRLKIASELLDISYEELKKEGIKSMDLEVRKSNEAAIRLYENQGFEKVGIRKGFYEKPKEDALIYFKEL